MLGVGRLGYGVKLGARCGWGGVGLELGSSCWEDGVWNGVRFGVGGLGYGES